jgi:hypothetical protein
MRGRMTPRMETLVARKLSPDQVEAYRRPPRSAPMRHISEIVWVALARLLRGAR